MILDNYIIELENLLATEQFAAKLSLALSKGAIIFLQGDLGAGKTTLVRSLITSLGFNGVVKSPTYTLVESYEINSLIIHHFDLYRLSDPSELEFIGIREYLDNNAVCLFEWPLKGEGFIPPPDLEISIKGQGNSRQLLINATSGLGQEILNKLKV